jgi:hypothetical protein
MRCSSDWLTDRSDVVEAFMREALSEGEEEVLEEEELEELDEEVPSSSYVRFIAQRPRAFPYE